MKGSKASLPATLEGPGVTIRTEVWGGMASGIHRYAKGTDFTPLLKGLKDDLCQCPHWGYVLKGALHLRYADGREEVAEAGEIWYAPPGHTGWVEEDTEVVDFSPEAQFVETLTHVKKQAGG